MLNEIFQKFLAVYNCKWYFCLGRVSEVVLTSHEQFGHKYHQPGWNCLWAMGTCSLILSLKLLSLILFISSEIPWKMCKIFECWLFRHCSCGCSFHHCYDKVLWLLNVGPVRRTSGTTFSQLPSYEQAVGSMAVGEWANNTFTEG